MRRVAWVLLVAMVAAGCTSAPDAGQGGDAPATPPDDASPMAIAAPANWSVGDHWTYQMSGEGIENREATLVVAEAAGGEYVVETTDRGMAFFDARPDTDPISYLGPQRQGDRAGSQNDTRVRFFKWPLELNGSWTTTWDGTERTIRVEDVGDSGAVLVARDPDGEVDVRYTYDDEAGWFGELRYFENGSETFALSLSSSGSNFSETYVEAELTTVFDANWTGSDGDSWNRTLGPAVDDFWYQVAYAVDGPGDVGLGYSNVNGTGTGGDSVVQEACPCDGSAQGTVDAPAGNWSWSGGITSTGDVQGTAYMDVTVFLRDFVQRSL